jgi:hypothetical protein
LAYLSAGIFSLKERKIGMSVKFETEAGLVIDYWDKSFRVLCGGRYLTPVLFYGKKIDKEHLGMISIFVDGIYTAGQKDIKIKLTNLVEMETRE